MFNLFKRDSSSSKVVDSLTFCVIDLSVLGRHKTSFRTSFPPHSEADLLKTPEYNKYYWNVGLGAPLDVTVTEYQIGKANPRPASHEELENINIGKAKTIRSYLFKVKIKGNYMDVKQINAASQKANVVCDHMDMNPSNYTITFTFSDENAEKVHTLYLGLCNHSNLEVHEGQNLHPAGKNENQVVCIFHQV